MESSTKPGADPGVEQVIAAFERGSGPGPLDLEASARRQKALVRRRQIRSAHDLLRLVLVYCVQDWSLNLLGAWAVLHGLGRLSDVALLKRLRGCPAWLGDLVYQCLQQRGLDLARLPGILVSFQDASVVNAPGATGTQWRLHVKLDLGQGRLKGLELTDAHGGETFARLAPEADEIVVGDRGYAFASSIGAVLARGGHVVVRINWQNLPLWQPEGQRFGLIDWLQSLQAPAEQALWLQTPHGRFAVRLLASPLPPQAAEAARRRAREAARKKHHQVSADTLLAAGFLLVLTDLSPVRWPLARVLWLYRLRWQVERHFKVCKSLLHFDHLRSHDPQLAQTYLLGKLLLLLLVEQLHGCVRDQQPDWYADPTRPVSTWRLTALLLDQLRLRLLGPLSPARFWACLSDLERYFRCRPRARPQQLAWGQALLEHLSCHFLFFGC